MATKGRPWTPAQRKNFLATAAKKRAEKLAGKDETPRMHSIPLSAIPDRPVKQAVKKVSGTLTLDKVEAGWCINALRGFIRSEAFDNEPTKVAAMGMLLYKIGHFLK